MEQLLRKVQDEVVGHCSHSFVCQDDPYDDDVPSGGNRDHESKQRGPNDLLEPGHDVRISVLQLGHIQWITDVQ